MYGILAHGTQDEHGVPNWLNDMGLGEKQHSKNPMNAPAMDSADAAGAAAACASAALAGAAAALPPMRAAASVSVSTPQQKQAHSPYGG